MHIITNKLSSLNVIPKEIGHCGSVICKNRKTAIYLYCLHTKMHNVIKTETLRCFKGLPLLQYSNIELGQNRYGCSLKASEFNSKIAFQVLKSSYGKKLKNYKEPYFSQLHHSSHHFEYDSGNSPKIREILYIRYFPSTCNYPITNCFISFLKGSWNWDRIILLWFK